MSDLEVFNHINKLMEVYGISRDEAINLVVNFDHSRPLFDESELMFEKDLPSDIDKRIVDYLLK